MACMELLLISALHPQVPCPEPERDEDGSSSECDSGAPSIAPESSQPGTSSQADSRPSQVSKLPNHNRQQTTAIDDALLKLVEQASATQRLCQQVDEVLSSNRNPRSMFSQWIGAETKMLPDHMFRQFQTEVFATVMTYRNTAAQQPQVTPILPTMPPVVLQHSGELPSAASPCLSSIAPQSMAWQPPTHVHSAGHPGLAPSTGLPAAGPGPITSAATHWTVVPKLLRTERTPVLPCAKRRYSDCDCDNHSVGYPQHWSPTSSE